MTVRESCKRAIKVFPRSVVTGRTGQSRRLFSASSPLRSSLKIEADPRRRRQQCLTTHGQDPEVVGRVPRSPVLYSEGVILLRWPFCVGLRFRVWHGLDGRPQLIDQRPAVADLLPLFDIGRSIPQCQEPLAAERSGV